MVGVAQLVEHLVVVQVAAGSSPVTHPKQKARSVQTDRAFFVTWVTRHDLRHASTSSHSSKSSAYDPMARAMSAWAQKRW